MQHRIEATGAVCKVGPDSKLNTSRYAQRKLDDRKPRFNSGRLEYALSHLRARGVEYR